MTDIEKVARAIVEAMYQEALTDEQWAEVMADGAPLMWGAAAITAMQPAPQWQEIESAPPPPNTRVFLAWRDLRDGKWLIEAAPYETGERVGPYSNVSRHGSVTNWLSLPTPPAGGSDAE